MNDYKSNVILLAKQLQKEDKTLPWFLAVRTAEAKLRQMSIARNLGFI